MSANDKPVVLSKPVSGDAAEQRLKTEVMQLPARERRRLKEIPDVGIASFLDYKVRDTECFRLAMADMYHRAT